MVTRAEDQGRVSCPSCAAEQRLEEGLLWTRCRGCRWLLFRPGGGPAVVIGHPSELLGRQIGLALLDGDFAPIWVRDGAAVLAAVRRHAARAAVLDVALEEPRSFEVVEQLRRGPSVAVVLVASVFNRTAYKRRPQSLYGADDYVEQHHIPDMLPAKVSRLLSLPEPTPPAWDDAVQEDIKRGEARFELSGAARVRALARSIVADIALYSEAELVRHARGDEVAAVAASVEEGRRLLAEMVRGAVAGDPIGEAFAELLSELRRRA